MKKYLLRFTDYGLRVTILFAFLVLPANAAEPNFSVQPQATIDSCTSVTLTWQTNEPTTAVVSYWKESVPSAILTASVTEYKNSHSLNLVFAEHQYSDVWRFQVVPKNSAGERPGITNTGNFTLSRCVDIDLGTPAPIISNVQVAALNCRETVVVWQTDKRSDSVLTVTNTITGETKTASNVYTESYHSLIFARPHSEAAVKYSFNVSSAASGNRASWPESGNRFFTMNGCEPEVGFSEFKIINQSCQDLDFGWKTTVPVKGVVRMWRLADPATVIESNMSQLENKSVVRLHTSPRSAPEEYGLEVITTNADGKITRHTPQDGKIRMYACVPR